MPSPFAAIVARNPAATAAIPVALSVRHNPNLPPLEPSPKPYPSISDPPSSASCRLPSPLSLPPHVGPLSRAPIPLFSFPSTKPILAAQFSTHTINSLLGLASFTQPRSLDSIPSVSFCPCLPLSHPTATLPSFLRGFLKPLL